MRPRAGFTLIEIIVAIAVLVILAATVTPSVVRQLDRARIDAAALQLQAVADAVFAFQQDIGETAGPPADRPEYPLSLQQLVQAVSTAETNICGIAYDATDVSEWVGPYLDRSVPAAGLTSAIGTIQNNFVFVQGGNNDLLQALLPAVTEEDALQLDLKVDGDGSMTTGTVRWSAPDAQGLVTLNYTLPIGNAC